MRMVNYKKGLKKYSVKFDLHYKKPTPISYYKFERKDNVEVIDTYYAINEEHLLDKLSQIYLGYADILNIKVLKVSNI